MGAAGRNSATAVGGVRVRCCLAGCVGGVPDLGASCGVAFFASVSLHRRHRDIIVEQPGNLDASLVIERCIMQPPGPSSIAAAA